jgi:osmotically-inducible protein OsmY
MDKHYGSQEGREAQGQDRQNGQRWNERYRDDDRGMHGARGGEYGDGWEPQDDRRWSASGNDLDRQDMSEHQGYGGPRGRFGSRGQSNQQRFPDQAEWSQGRTASRAQTYGNEPYGGGQGNYGTNRGFSNQGYPGQTFGQGYAGPDFGSRGLSNQDDSSQRFNQGTDQSRGRGSQGEWNQGWGQSGQSYGQTFGQGYSQGYTGQDSSSRGAGRGFSGRGPKGYQRSDERIKEQLSDRLMDDDNIDATEITIEVKNGEVTLNGTVNSREEKRAAEDLAERSPGVREVQNHLRINQKMSSGSRQESTSKSSDSTSSQSKSRNERD